MSGTFAVVSLMVGSTVDRLNCDENYASIIGSDDDGGGGGGGLMNETTTTAMYDNTTMSSEDSADVVKCKVAVAAAVTFLGGALQVRACMVCGTEHNRMKCAIVEYNY